jgi:hypothetical protein
VSISVGIWLGLLVAGYVALIIAGAMPADNDL